MKRQYVCWSCSWGHIRTEIESWVSRRRDLGGLIFIDLRDRRRDHAELVINQVSAEVMVTAESLRSEYVIEVTGQGAAREQANDKLATGQLGECNSSYCA